MKNFEKQLKNQLPDFEIPTHKKILKEYLMKEFTQNDTRKRNFFMKGGEYIMRHKTFAYAATAFAVITLAIGIAVIPDSPFTNLSPAKAEAQEIVDKSLTRVIHLSEAEQKELSKMLKADLESSLQEARTAKDLEVIPENEVTRIEMPQVNDNTEFVGTSLGTSSDGEKLPEQDGKTPVTGVSSHAVDLRLMDGKFLAPKGVTVLRYTDIEGRKVHLGIDREDKPVFKMMMLEKEEREHLEQESRFMQVKPADR